MDIAKILLLALGIMTIVYMVYLVRDVVTHKEEHLPMKTIPVLLIGLLANFLIRLVLEALQHQQQRLNLQSLVKTISFRGQ